MGKSQEVLSPKPQPVWAHGLCKDHELRSQLAGSSHPVVQGQHSCPPWSQSLSSHSWAAVEVQKAPGAGMRMMGLSGSFPSKGPIV